jgi:hypothetical protein
VPATHERNGGGATAWHRKSRAAGEGRISVAKRRHGLNRSRYKGDRGMKRWVGIGVIADTLFNIGPRWHKRRWSLNKLRHRQTISSRRSPPGGFVLRGAIVRNDKNRILRRKVASGICRPAQ